RTPSPCCACVSSERWRDVVGPAGGVPSFRSIVGALGDEARPKEANMEGRLTRAKGAVMLVVAGLVMGLAVMAAADGGGGGGGDEGTRRDPTAAPRDPRYDEGVRAVKRGDYPAAIRLFEAVTARDTNDADAFNWLAYSTRKNGDAARSIPIYEKALAIDP